MSNETRPDGRSQRRWRRRFACRPLAALGGMLALLSGGSPAAVAAEERDPACTCDCDIDGDGDCTPADLIVLLACLGTPPGPACPDFVCDGVIDAKDVASWECLAAGNGPRACCERVESKWTQRPHGNTDPPMGFNVPSNLDWNNLATAPPGSPGPGPNVVVADDFRSDGRPITAVRWWGSYVDPAFEPGEPRPCSCDLDGDGDCTVADLNQLLQCFGAPPGPGCPDLDCDGVIGNGDVAIWECLAAGNPPEDCCPDCPEPEPIAPCTCDIDGDGTCSFADLNLLLQCIGSPPGPGCPDLDCDGVIGDGDVAVWKCLFNGGTPEDCCPECNGGNEIDGWLVSFHTDLPADKNPDGFSRPEDLLGLYFCPCESVEIARTGIVGWDDHRVYRYRTDLDDCHLIHSYPDPRATALPPDPARVGKFLETEGFIYWLDVQAVVGKTYEKRVLCTDCDCDLDGSGACDFADLLTIVGCFGTPGCADINCDGATDQGDICSFLCLQGGGSEFECCADWVEVATDNRADTDFWGWHTSPDSWNDQSAAGVVIMTDDGAWRYREWFPVDGSAHELEVVDQAFELLTPICPADLDGDLEVGFSDLLLVLSTWGRLRVPSLPRRHHLRRRSGVR